jgi:hypothetical protein
MCTKETHAPHRTFRCGAFLFLSGCEMAPEACTKIVAVVLLDPQKTIVMTEVTKPDLSKVDEVGLATLSPGGDRGIAAV